MKLRLFIWIIVAGLLPQLACRTMLLSAEPTPTPTKTPRSVEAVAPTLTSTRVKIIPANSLPTPTPQPAMEGQGLNEAAPAQAEEPVVENSPTPEPLPTDTPEPTPTETPVPTATSVPPTNTPAPPPPPTFTPVPPTPTPIPLPPTEPPPPPPTGPDIVIELPNGDSYNVGDEIKIDILVRDPAGVKEFRWGVVILNEFGQIIQQLQSDRENCNGATECVTREEIPAILKGQFDIGVEAVNSKGESSLQHRQLYIG